MTKKETLLVNGERFEIEILAQERGKVRFAIDGRTYEVEREEVVPAAKLAVSGAVKHKKDTKATHAASVTTDGSIRVKAPIPGVITEVLVSEGEIVEANQLLLKLEAMKMQNRILAPGAGRVTAISVRVGQEISDGEELITLSPATFTKSV